MQLEHEKEPSREDDEKDSLASIVYEFALAYLDGVGTSKNPQKAYDYMKQAAKAGNVKAMLRLAGFFETGTGTTKSRSKAFQWREKAAHLRDPDGMYETAIAYGTRKGTEENPSEFHRWARDAVRAGHNKAFIALGLAELRNKDLITREHVSNILHLLNDLGQEVQQIKSKYALSEKKAPDGVAHFTTLETLHRMLPSESTASYSSNRGISNFLRLYNLSYVNDPQEGKILLPEEEYGTTTMQEFSPIALPAVDGSDDHNHSETVPLSGLAFSVYVGSFTLRSDRLDLWRAYGGDGTGFCIVTPVKSFVPRVESSDQAFAGLAASEENNSEIDLTLYRVEYEEEEIQATRKRLNEHLIKIRDAGKRIPGKPSDKEGVIRQLDLTVRAILSDVLYLYKHKEYKSEGEVRMLAPFAIAARAVCADERSPATTVCTDKALLVCTEFQDHHWPQGTL